jgi:tetratricopeptide (TPR) repeat protein
LAQAYLMKLLWTKALPLLEQTVKVQPTNAEALYQVSKCRIELGRQKAALESAEQLAQIKGNEARAHYLIGWLHTNLGNNQKAAEAMAMVLQHEPNADNLPIHPAVFFLDYGHLLLRAGQPELALVPLKRSVKIQPSSSGFLGLGNAASQLGNNEQALQAWKAALKEAPSNAAARRALANDALQNAKPNEALDWLKPLAESPRLSAGTAYLFQRAYSGLKDEVGIKAWTEKTAVLRKKEEFRSSLDAMITDDPDGFWARVARTHDYASQGNWDQAESLLPSILQDAPGDPFIIELADAVRRRVELPAIEQIPISQN